ncbi:hypothetical protein ABZ896_01195 [Streptomyces sp. NPDC047072]|uniref:hypothetical protein n=1 Tax=Streptomyces sp. NPDC047072 TaxID=3154809 RepID=UPI0033E2EC57
MDAALERLDVLVGEWVVEAEFPGAEAVTGRAVFEWTLDGRFLVQRTAAPGPVPDSMAIVAAGAADGTYTQHYFDSRGVVRTYAMTFDGEVWQLLRERADFSPLDFRQRFVGRVEDGGDTIRGAWETGKVESGEWERDFGVSYRRIR